MRIFMQICSGLEAIGLGESFDPCRERNIQILGIWDKNIWASDGGYPFKSRERFTEQPPIYAAESASCKRNSSSWRKRTDREEGANFAEGKEGKPHHSHNHYL